MAEVYKRGRDFLGSLGVDSYVAWEITYNDDPECSFLYANVNIADCNRRIELCFYTLSDLAKLDVLRDHLDRFEREFRKRYKQVNDAKD